ncbi:alpha/beta fold hydrolase [Rubrivivax albus]|uniref:Alpha/beta hydrolase n=1 Tax=Rubrivivax albus TaxID=2499835 RepID=A0A3S2TLX1_9BURK|nr:alpha/beta hydrolase [Rubrivivax albus]RVT51289.1 alpha/beta hydrolase [Rubrivivax albus]
MIRFWRLAYSRTPPILDATGSVKAGSVAELIQVPIGGIHQTLLIRGHDCRRPVLLFLHGGPGGSAMPLYHLFANRLEEHFVVVLWDQRGAGKSYSPDIPAQSMTTAQLVQDCQDVARYLIDRFGCDRVLLVGHSWGTELGVLTLQQAPQLFSGYVGVSQVVSKQRAEAISMNFALEAARRAGDRKAEERLAHMEPPGYGGSVEDLLEQRRQVSRFGGTFFDPADDKRLFRKVFESHEYSLGDLRRLKEGSNWSLRTMWQDRLDLDMTRDVPELTVPVLFLQGRADRVTPGELVQEYLDALHAPRKRMVWFERSGHCPLFEEPDRFQQVLIDAYANESSAH